MSDEIEVTPAGVSWDNARKLDEWFDKAVTLQAENERLQAENKQLASRLNTDAIAADAHVDDLHKRINTLNVRNASLQAEVERLKVSHERYEKLRKLNVEQFKGLYLANIQGAGRFDDLVDALFEVSE